MIDLAHGSIYIAARGFRKGGVNVSSGREGQPAKFERTHALAKQDAVRIALNNVLKDNGFESLIADRLAGLGAHFGQSAITLRLFLVRVNQQLRSFSPYSFEPAAIDSEAFLDKRLLDLEGHLVEKLT